MRGDSDYLHDILDAGARIAAYVKGQTLESFDANLMCRDAVLYRLAVIGEAAGRLSKSIRESRPDVPWSRVVAMRNILVHDYGGVDIGIAWETAVVHVPALMAVARNMLPPDDPQYLAPGSAAT